MSGQVQRLREQLKTVTQLQSVVETIRALAEVNARRAQAVARDVGQYARAVHLALHVVLHSLRREERWVPGASRGNPRGGAASGKAPLIALVITSDQGLCGAFHQRIASYALALLEREAPDKSRRGVITIGYRGLERMRAAGETILAHCDGAGSIEAMPAVTGQALAALEAQLQRFPDARVVVVCNRPDDGRGFREDHFQLHPFDVERWLALPEGEPPFRTIPAHDLAPRELLKLLVREQIYVDLWRALVDSFAAENDARLSAMRNASDNIEERLGDLQTQYRRQRQEWVTQELMDVMGGVEAASSAQPRREKDWAAALVELLAGDA
ncbi:MAG: F0F1 ATP synthase subunit gamma [Limnochordales bacterium]|nr:MAG: hypothetical protein DIU82_10885 [Bacillota bacterium]HLT59450.1 FoF1 ATP synthase subunit gamma [Limnochordales bacterium]